MAEDEDVEVEEDEVEVEELPSTPDPGPPATSPTPPEPTEEELEQAAKEKEEAEDAAREAAEGQPEDPSVEAKARNPVLVLKDQFDAEWPTVAAKFPGVEPEFGKEKDGYAELLNVQAPAMAYAASSPAPVAVLSKPERTKHGWEDFQDNTLPPTMDDRSEDDIEAKPKRGRQTKVSTRA